MLSRFRREERCRGALWQPTFAHERVWIVWVRQLSWCVYSWGCFTHPQSQVYRPSLLLTDFGLILRYHPCGRIKEKLIMALTDLPALPPLQLRFWSS